MRQQAWPDLDRKRLKLNTGPALTATLAYLNLDNDEEFNQLDKCRHTYMFMYDSERGPFVGLIIQRVSTDSTDGEKRMNDSRPRAFVFFFKFFPSTHSWHEG